MTDYTLQLVDEHGNVVNEGQFGEQGLEDIEAVLDDDIERAQEPYTEEIITALREVVTP